MRYKLCLESTASHCYPCSGDSGIRWNFRCSHEPQYGRWGIAEKHYTTNVVLLKCRFRLACCDQGFNKQTSSYYDTLNVPDQPTQPAVVVIVQPTQREQPDEQALDIATDKTTPVKPQQLEDNVATSLKPEQPPNSTAEVPFLNALPSHFPLMRHTLILSWPLIDLPLRLQLGPEILDLLPRTLQKLRYSTCAVIGSAPHPEYELAVSSQGAAIDAATAVIRINDDPAGDSDTAVDIGRRTTLRLVTDTDVAVRLVEAAFQETSGSKSPELILLPLRPAVIDALRKMQQAAAAVNKPAVSTPAQRLRVAFRFVSDARLAAQGCTEMQYGMHSNEFSANGCSGVSAHLLATLVASVLCDSLTVYSDDFAPDRPETRPSGGIGCQGTTAATKICPTTEALVHSSFHRLKLVDYRPTTPARAQTEAHQQALIAAVDVLRPVLSSGDSFKIDQQLQLFVGSPELPPVLPALNVSDSKQYTGLNYRIEASWTSERVFASNSKLFTILGKSAQVFATLPVFSRTTADTLNSSSWKTCAVVGSAGWLRNPPFRGAEIDAHDAVFRLNWAPTKGFEHMVGARTTGRIIRGLLLGASVEHLGFDNTTNHPPFVIVGSRGYTHPQTRAALLQPQLAPHLLWPSLEEARMSVADASSGPNRNIWQTMVCGPTSGMRMVHAALVECDTVSLFGFGPNVPVPDSDLTTPEYVLDAPAVIFCG